MVVAMMGGRLPVMVSFGNSHWMSVARRGFRDAAVFVLAFLAANYTRFTEFYRLEHYTAPITAGVLGLVIASYVLGLYSVEARGTQRFFAHGLLFTVAFVVALIAVTLVGYVDFGTRVGRGFMALGFGFAYPALLIHHWVMFNKHRFAPERIAFLAETPEEIAEYERFKKLQPRGTQVAGRIDVSGAAAEGDLLGRVKHIRRILGKHRINRVVFAEHRMDDPETRSHLRRLRYSGTPCTPLITLCEEYMQYVPLHLVTGEWLLHSDNSPRELYFRKLKRTFDVVTSLVLLVLLAPVLLAGMVLVRIVSPEGPVFYRQERVGRFGRNFQILKLRSMRPDAEKDGPQWSSATADPRVFPGGALMRKYRIDEIPQLFNVLRGDMSFVGPRPERPGFVQALAAALPFYEERHMIHPGLTGWAQVCYPYGSSIEDARCKLEYDLYYLKHAGIVFDLLILLDTIRVVLSGGMSRQTNRPRYHSGALTTEAAAEPEPEPQQEQVAA